MYKIDPAHMQDIFVFAKDSFLESYSYFSEEEYDEMVTEFFRENYTEKEVNDSLPLSECSEPVKRAYGYKGGDACWDEVIEKEIKRQLDWERKYKTSPYHKNPLDDEWEDDNE